MNPELKAVAEARSLGADASEEFAAFREAMRVRREIKAAVEMAFIAKGWK